jgi:hypothetical protein
VESERRWVGGYCGFTTGLVDVADKDFCTFCCEGFGDAGAEA